MSEEKLLKKMRKEPQVAALLHMFKTNSQLKLAPEKLVVEIMNLHNGRPIRTMMLSTGRIPSKVMKANLADQRARSRIVEILANVRRVSHEFSNRKELVRELLMSQNRAGLASIRSRVDKESLIEYGLFPDIVSYIDRLSEVEKAGVIVLEDIDQASYTMQRHVNMMKDHVFGRNREHDLAN